MYRWSGTTRRWLLPSLACTTLAAVTLLGIEVVRTERSYHREAEATLEDHAHVAAWQYAHWAEALLGSRVNRVMQPLLVGPWNDISLKELLDDSIAAVKRCDCPQLKPEWAFRFRNGKLSTSKTVPPALHQAIHDHVSAARQDEAGASEALHAEFTRFSGDLYLVGHRGTGNDEEIIGLMTPAEGLDSTLAELRGRIALLPPTLLDRETATEMLAVRVLAGREVLHASGSVSAEDSFHTARVDLRDGGSPLGQTPTVLSGVTIEARLDESAADHLLIGGSPRSRLPSLLGLLVLSMVLATIAIRQVFAERRLARLRTEMVAGIAHDLRTPLAKMRMYIETLRLGRTRNDREKRRALEIADRESLRLTELVDNVLRFHAAERGAVRVVPREMDLADFLRHMAAECRSLHPDNKFALRIGEDTERRVAADPDALKRIVHNLVENAARYAGPGTTITLCLERARDGTALAVEDEGPGIPLEARERIWKRFARGVSAASPAYQGTGIGLAVVMELVRAHGGDVAIETAPGGGARFVVVLRPDSSGQPRDETHGQ